MSKKKTRTPINWRVSSGWEALPKSDRKWTQFCVIEESGETGAAVRMITSALNSSRNVSLVKMDFKSGGAK